MPTSNEEGLRQACAKIKDREAANEMLRIYNNFMNNFCSYYPDRMIGLACLPYNNIEGAAREVAALPSWA
jgi:hypothetical protein